MKKRVYQSLVAGGEVIKAPPGYRLLVQEIPFDEPGTPPVVPELKDKGINDRRGFVVS